VSRGLQAERPADGKEKPDHVFYSSEANSRSQYTNRKNT
jgi:hypothetical protein